MDSGRRKFIHKAGLGAAAGIMGARVKTDLRETPEFFKNQAMKQALITPVLNIFELKKPVWITSIELLRKEDNFICRVRSKDGAEGIAVSNNMQMIYLYPIFLHRIQPFFIGKDARNLETLLEEVYVYKSNYKLQSLALWVPLATLEFAILDMLGYLTDKSIGELIGEIHNPKIAVYQANNYRGKSAEESIDLIEAQVQETGAKALKFKIGGRMSNDRDFPSGRSVKLIPLVRERFGANMTIYADSNGSYSVEEAVRIGKILQEYKLDFYEEPVPFDWYEETLEVNKALKIPIAGGEQEPSIHNFKWLIENDALDIVQPDIFYFGGMIRSMKVSRMAAITGKECTPHISGSGLGYLYMLHFVSAIPNAGPYHEFKGLNRDIPLDCPTSDLSSVDGTVSVPTGAGLGVTLDPDFVKAHKIVKG
ncbi:mandelate racemase/muconate lactonizing enzyme family protein [Cyclobacterium sediminis]